MVNDTIQDVNQALHNVGMATWVGGTIFGRLALNPAVSRITSHAERGAVVNAAWNRFNVINTLAMTAVGAGHVGGRLTELNWDNLSDREKPFVRAMDVFTATGVTTGVLSGIQARRLARQAPDGAVPVETGSQPAPETPPQAARIQKSINALGRANIASGLGLVVSTGLFWRSAVSHPPVDRAVRRAGTAQWAKRKAVAKGANRALQAGSLAVAAAAVAKELREPPRRREWTGAVMGVPYDFRRPTAEKIRRNYWSPDDDQILKPRAFGVGWDVNAGRVARLATRSQPRHLSGRRS